MYIGKELLQLTSTRSKTAGQLADLVGFVLDEVPLRQIDGSWKKARGVSY